MQSPASDLLEVRVYGLNISITTDALGEFLGKGVRIRGILLHAPPQGAYQWAQVWVASEEEVSSLLGLRDALAANGITISRVSKAAPKTPPQTSWDLVSQLSKMTRPTSTTGFSLSSLPSVQSLPFGRTEASSLPRNLYVLNLPLDLTQVEFKALFTAHGVVEHAILLSQLDGIGRRRGFVLMSGHREALEVMEHMHGKWIDGFKLDISWALVQREAKSISNNPLPNRVVHPPAVSTHREPSSECAVIVENLDTALFPDVDTIGSVFRSFGPIYRVVKISETPLSVIIQFEGPASAMTLINANGLRLGDRVLVARALGSTGADTQNANFDPFAENNWPEPRTKLPMTPRSLGRASRLSADSQPFVPSFNPKPTRENEGTEFKAPFLDMASRLATHPTGKSSSDGWRSAKSHNSDATLASDV